MMWIQRKMYRSRAPSGKFNILQVFHHVSQLTVSKRASRHDFLLHAINDNNDAFPLIFPEQETESAIWDAFLSSRFGIIVQRWLRVRPNRRAGEEQV